MTCARPESLRSFSACLGLLLIALSFWSAEAFCQAPSAVEQQARGASARYAALQALNAKATTLGKDNLDSRADAMEQQILDEAPQHRERAPSVKIVRSSVEKSIDDEFERITATVWEKFRLEELGIGRAVFEKEVRQKLGPRFSDERDKSLNANFERVFSDARRRAVDQQGRKFRAATYPSQEQVEAIDRQGWESAAGRETAAQIERSVKGAEATVFEENQKQVTQLVKEVRQSIDGQRAAQLQRLDATELPAGALSKDLAKTTLEESLRELLAAERAKPMTGFVYAELPAARQRIEEISSKAEVDRFMQFLKEFKLEIDPAELRARIDAEPEVYKERQPTQEKLTQELLRMAESRALRDYTQQSLSGTDMNAFRTRLVARIGGAAGNEVLRTAISEQLSAVLGPVRDEIALSQAKEYFSPVATRTWAVPESELKSLIEKHSEPSDFGQCMRLEGVTGKQPVLRNRLLSETETLVLKSVRELISEGREAWVLQVELVNRLAAPLQSEMAAAEKNGELGKKDVWVNKLTTRVENEWSSSRTGALWPNGTLPPANAATKYQHLFGETHHLIAQMVNRHFESYNKPVSIKTNENAPTAKIDKLPGNDGGKGGGGGGSGAGGGQGDGTGFGGTGLIGLFLALLPCLLLALAFLVIGAVTGYLFGMKRGKRMQSAA